MQSIVIPEITRTPGTIPGAQFNFADLLQAKIKSLVGGIGVRSIIAMHISQLSLAIASLSSSAYVFVYR